MDHLTSNVLFGWLLTSDIKAMTEFKHSLKWYRLRHKNRGILRDSASLHNHGL